MSIKLNELSTGAHEKWDKKETKKITKQLIKEIDLMQEILYAQGKQSLLIIFQGLDASGKDGATKKVLGRLNPQGVKVTSFKKPSKEELNHDFLWRVHKNTPEKGMIQVFNRSHYEDVLVTRVLGYTSPKQAKKRFQQINAFENLVESNGTKIIKFFLHVGKDKQREKFEDRLQDPTKYWKYNPGDWETRKHWDEYMTYYHEVFDECNKPEWNIIPADDNWFKEHLIASKIHETLSSMKLEYPDLPAEWESEKKKYLK